MFERSFDLFDYLELGLLQTKSGPSVKYFTLYEKLYKKKIFITITIQRGMDMEIDKRMSVQ